MEGDDQRRRQHEHSSFPRGPVPDPRTNPDIRTSLPNANRPMDLEMLDRYRQARLMSTQPPTSTALPVNSMAQDISSFGPFQTAQTYQSTQLHGSGTPYQYQPEYPSEPQRQQPFSQQYTPQIMYNTQQAPQQTPFDPVVQYQARQTAPSEVLQNTFNDPQFFNSGVGVSTSVPTSVASQFSTTSYQQPLQYPPPAEVERHSVVPQYPDPPSDFTQPVTPTVAEPAQQQPDRYDAFYNQYRRALRETNENTLRGRLVEAGESLLEISQWLLGNVEGLELNKDNQAIHQERLKLWKDFNNCWLAFLVRQLDDTKRIQATGRGPLVGQSVLSETALQNLGDELTRLCDGLEKSGLVDYEMGVWEEEIVHLLLQCKDIVSASNEDPGLVGRAGPSQGLNPDPGHRQRQL